MFSGGLLKLKKYCAIVVLFIWCWFELDAAETSEKDSKLDENYKNS